MNEFLEGLAYQLIKIPNVFGRKLPAMPARVDRGMAKIVTRDSARSCNAFGEWPDHRIENVGDILAASISKSEFYVVYAVATFDPNRIRPYLDKIIPPVFEDWALWIQTGHRWSDEFFYRYIDRIYETLDQDPSSLIIAAGRWKPERVKPCQKLFAEKYAYDEKSRERLESLDLQAQAMWHFFVRDFPGEIIEELNPPELQLLLNVYDLVRPGDEEKQAFYESLVAVIQAGTVDPWAKHIIDQYRADSIGGDQPVRRVA